MSDFGSILTVERRGRAVENIYRGSLVVVDINGKVIFSRGAPSGITFYRSASKPVQALPAIVRALDARFGITEEESVIFAGSHAGEDFHLAALESIFKKAGLDEQELVMLPGFPANVEANEGRIKAGIARRKLYHNCAGKHAALMLLQRDLSGQTTDYHKKNSPADLEVRRAIEVLSECEIAADGLDGCGVPVFAVPLQNMAIAYKNLARPEKIRDDALAAAASSFVPRVNKHPKMMRGTGFICGHINEDENIIAKGGAAGVYGLGLKKQGLGLALKLESGSEGAWANVLLTALRGLGALTPGTGEMLERLGAFDIFNDCGQTAGSRSAAFSVSIHS